MEKINCQKIAEDIIKSLKNKSKIKKIMVAILVGENVASLNFLKQKEKVAKQLNIGFKLYQFPKEIENKELKKEIEKISLLKNVGGIIIQLPLPNHLNRDFILKTIPPEKDIDALNKNSLVFPPPVGVIKTILINQKLNLKNLKVVVIGQGFLIGKPITNWIKNKCKKLHIIDEGDNFNILKKADLIISGVGKPGLFGPEDLKNKATVIDFGYSIKHETKNKICGDFNASSSMLHSSGFYTPTPGGTGPILITQVFENFYKLNT
ncbi:bifunctional 5,10-methylenetetrahydrofolate dehydrogenase/5,10-methenyltetrahydrofolate cyclohydrolase [Candidatus Wolfebacteria bacterium]|nr:bifunctional 5,10-methylenetetrahydrofolate dehydrogenase/5,10-methenyltetrahydrofolate cyclohydrolase [Candidatus Wolfebacteria bacterium]